MINIEEVCKKYSISLKKVEYYDWYFLLFSDNKIYLLKDGKDNKKLLSYFETIHYSFYLKRINENIDSYQLYVYPMNVEKDSNILGQELIKAISDLQLKTVFDEEILEDKYNNFYQKVIADIDYQMKYYLDLQDYIEGFSFPRLDYYYLLLHISSIYKILQRARYYFDLWYKKKNLKFRKCYSIHNVSTCNFIASDSSCFIDFSECYQDLIITDFVNFYRNELLSFDMISLFDIYQKSISFREEELLLLKTFICIPKRLDFSKNTYANTVSIYYLLEYIEKTNLFLEENEKNQEANEYEFKE